MPTRENEHIFRIFFFGPFLLKKLLKYLSDEKLSGPKTCFVSCHFELFSVKIGQKLTSLRKNQKGESF